MNSGGLPPAERRDRLRLIRTENVGPVAFQQLISRFGTAARAIEGLPKLALRGGRLAPLRTPSVEEAEAEMAAGEALGARLLVWGDADFPPYLAAVDPPPPVIWATGHPSLLSKPSVAVVGARTASAVGMRFARSLALDLGQAGYPIVSGLARGIDGAAHEGSLATGAIAVLAGGIDDIYPPEHAGLYARIAAEGCLVSESPVGMRATAKDFPRRNRIISGLSIAVVVVEAELRSGSLITARLAAEQGREVFAVPGSPLDPRAKGCNDLIRQGAHLCEGAEDVLRAIQTLALAREPDQGFEGAPADQEALDQAADRLRGRLEGLLTYAPVSRDELVRSVGAPAPTVLAALVELSLAGRAVLLPGSLVARAATDE
jgi:DNA processing protein